MDSRPAADSVTQLTHWMTIVDANNAGNVHGGVIMRLCDQAAGLACIKHSRRRVVTVSMDRMSFVVPVRVGDLVTFTAVVNAAWRTSMDVGVNVTAENPREGGSHHTNTAYLTFVALDDDGKPAPVPALLLETDAERRREAEAQRRRASRLSEREQQLTGDRGDT